MSHEITNQDQVVLHRETAWHGLGVVVEDAPTPREALALANMEWGVVQTALYAKDPSGEERELADYVANYRADTNTLLGVVSRNYQPIQNVDVADFCEALLDEGQVRCETAGTIRSGARIWFLLKGEEFSVAKGDGIFPYILVSNGHDGGATFRVTPTTVRAVCSNTLHCAIPRDDDGELQQSAISIKHTTNIMERVQAAKLALRHYNNSLEKMKGVINTLTNKDVSSEEVQKFFLECYTWDFDAIPDNPTNKAEERARNRAHSAYDSFSRRFDDEREIAGTSMWCALNAYSGLVQHDRKARGKDDADRIEKRVVSNVFGLNQDRTQHALQVAFRMLG